MKDYYFLLSYCLYTVPSTFDYATDTSPPYMYWTGEYYYYCQPCGMPSDSYRPEQYFLSNISQCVDEEYSMLTFIVGFAGSVDIEICCSRSHTVMMIDRNICIEKELDAMRRHLSCHDHIFIDERYTLIKGILRKYLCRSAETVG